MQFSNQQIAKILRNIAAAYTIKQVGNIFQIRAYGIAADSIEHSTVELYDLWQEGKLASVPALGEKIRSYIDELFETGKVAHFEQIMLGIKPVVFELLDIAGVGPKTAQEIASLNIKNIDELKKQIKTGELVAKGFSGKIAQKIMQGISDLNSRSGRMLLPYAFAQAQKIIHYLQKYPEVLKIEPLGSLRRMVATVGDLDFAVASNEAKKVVDYFCSMPMVARVLNQGGNKASVILKTGIQADLLVGELSSYGALLQHFTGSKNHNIHIRSCAQTKGLSLSEYGVKDEETKKIIETKDEIDFYKLLKMDVPPPEIREDTGEIEAALEHRLPKLVELQDIKGDLHLHSNFPIERPSHGPGVNSIEEMVARAKMLGYKYVGISDHSPSPSLSTNAIKDTIEKRTKFVHRINTNTNSIRVLNGLEIDILSDGNLSVPDAELETLDYCIAGIHSGHKDSKDMITKRLLSALNNPHVDIISHPTNRLLNERGSSEADWEQVFEAAARNKKILEINAYPNRLDLRDDLVRLAKSYGVKFIIDTDAHGVAYMDNMRFGVAVARRGWLNKEDVVNTWDWTKFAKWFKIR